MKMWRSLLLGMGAVSSLAVSVQAQPKQTVAIRVGTIETAQECTLYQGIKYSNDSRSSGSSGGYVSASGSGYASPYGGGGSSSVSGGYSSSYSASSKTRFETFFVKDCTSNFEGVRSAMEAALASTGSIIVGGGGYVLSGRVEDVVPVASGYVDRGGTGKAYGTVSNGLKVTMSFKVADKAGRVVFGYPIVTEIETDYASTARGTTAASVSSGEGLYSILQQQLALAASRKIAFHFQPLVVSQGGGRRIQLNYGAPLLETGAILSVTSTEGAAAARYRVTSVSTGTALAEQIGDADSRSITAGSVAVVIEKGDPAANQSVLERVELP
jgi:hypothetical protein